MIIKPNIKDLRALFERNGYEFRIAGGAPRDLLLSIIPHDIDFATTATPTEMIKMFNKENIRMINSNGEKHGTVTVHIDGENYEITTLRIDRVTDGRHAEVEFTTDWQTDANRRDLTVNSMFLTLDGEIIDFFNAQDDLLNRHVRFVGNPADRIQEDYLRILRYFRFYSRISLSADQHMPDHLEAIQKYGNGLEQMSGERVWTELAKIIDQRFNFEFFELSYKLGIAPFIGLPENGLRDKEERYQRIAEHRHVHVMTKLTVLADSTDDVLKMDKRLKWSKQEFALAMFLVKLAEKVAMVEEGDLQRFEFYKRLMARTKFNLFGFTEIHKRVKTYDQAWVVQLAIFNNESPNLIERLTDYEMAECPVPSGKELIAIHGVEQGKIVGAIRKRLLDAWVGSGLTMTAEEVADKLEELKNDFKSNEGKQKVKKAKKDK